MIQKRLSFISRYSVYTLFYRNIYTSVHCTWARAYV